jgi:hypothetical protein
METGERKRGRDNPMRKDWAFACCSWSPSNAFGGCADSNDTPTVLNDCYALDLILTTPSPDTGASNSETAMKLIGARLKYPSTLSSKKKNTPTLTCIVHVLDLFNSSCK